MTGCAQGPSEEPSPPRQPSGGSPAPCGPPNSYQPCCSISCCCFPSPSLWQVSFSITSLANPPASPFHLTAASFSFSSLRRGEGGCLGRCRGRTTPPPPGGAGGETPPPSSARQLLPARRGRHLAPHAAAGRGLRSAGARPAHPAPGEGCGAERCGGSAAGQDKPRCACGKVSALCGENGTFWWFPERSMLPATFSHSWKGTRGSPRAGSPGDTENRGRKFHRCPEVLPAVIRT